MNIESLTDRRILCRKVQGIAAALLPFQLDGQVSVADTHRAGLMNAVNMDTGYVNFLDDAERQNVLRWAREALGNGVAFVAGAYIEGQTGDIVTLYRRQMDSIVSHGATPILFQTGRLHGKTPTEKVAVYREVARGYSHVLAFELGSMFAPNGEIFDLETFLGLMDIPEIKGLKHSSLNRLVELDRLSLRDVHRPDFRIYTGNDLGINMAFRHPVPAYKHSAAVFLHLTGRIPSSLSHPKNVTRPPWEHEILRDCALRLDYEVVS